ncbi:MAG: XrtA-associated tyrosine autokinase [Gammaproteobacteria bacterium]|nr:XrtA-associated tyrosine autokinase [Gammaproteobacteria bacterium]
MNSIEKVVELLRKNSAEISRTVNVENTKFTNEIIPKTILDNKQKVKIDFDGLQDKGFITPDTIGGEKSEEYRVIKRPILRNAFGKGAVSIPNGNMIMISSSLPGEGKTYTSLSLAMSISLELDTTVLLVDCDLINPSLSRLLEVDENIGLTDYLVDPAIALEDVILNTSIPQLRLIPSGARHEQSNELLTSTKMTDLIKELSERYTDRVVLFDTPPLLLANQARVMSQLMGQIIVVVEAEVTPQNIVKEAIDLLDHDKAIGIILNKTRKLSGGNYYGAYHYNSSSKE